MAPAAAADLAEAAVTQDAAQPAPSESETAATLSLGVRFRFAGPQDKVMRVARALGAADEEQALLAAMARVEAAAVGVVEASPRAGAATGTAAATATATGTGTGTGTGTAAVTGTATGAGTGTATGAGTTKGAGKPAGKADPMDRWD
jgi:hypothetical protein